MLVAALLAVVALVLTADTGREVAIILTRHYHSPAISMAGQPDPARTPSSVTAGHR